MDDSDLEEYIYIMNSIIHDIALLLSIINQFKKLFSLSMELFRKSNIAESIEKLNDIICKILKCERSSVFIVDEASSEIWTKLDKGTKTVRLPINSGISESVIY